MLNIATIEQKDFQAGELQHLPDNQIPGNGVLRLLNMLPGDNSEPLSLRNGFQEWTYDYSYDGDVINITRYVAHIVLDSDADSPFLSTGYIVAEHEGTTDIALNVVLPFDDCSVPATWYSRSATASSNVLTNAGHGLVNGSKVRTSSWGLSDGYYYVVSKATDTFSLATTYGGSVATLTNGSGTYLEEIINDEVVWSTYGSSEIPSSEEPPPEVINPLPSVTYMFKDIPGKTICNGELTDGAQTIIDDYWPDSLGQISGVDSENNWSCWHGNAVVSDWGGAQLTIGEIDTYFWDNTLDGPYNWVGGDRWSNPVSVYTTADEVDADTIRFHYPVYFEYNAPSAAPLATWTVPEVKEPYFTIDGLPLGQANRTLEFVFSYDVRNAEKFGLCAVIFVRNANSETWGTAVTGDNASGTTAVYPVVMTQQSYLDTESEKYTQPSVNNGADGTVKFSYTCPYSTVDIKVVFLPHKKYAGNGDTIGGTFRSLAVK